MCALIPSKACGVGGFYVGAFTTRHIIYHLSEMVMMGIPKFYIVHRVHEHERIHAHNHHNEVTFSSCSWMNYCTREREREREWAGLSTDSARAIRTLAKGLWLIKRLGSVGGSVGGWVRWEASGVVGRIC
jgi:hypothetical protein